MADADALRDAGVPNLLPAPSASEPIAPSPAPATPGEKVMTLVDHLSELRRRLVISAIAILIGTGVGFLRVGDLIHLAKGPIGDRKLNFLSPGEGFFISIKLSIVVGLVLAMPVLLYQLWAFISPGLTV